MSLVKVIERLRELNEPVPCPFRLPTEAEITAAEKTLGVQFPADYRYFLLHGSDVAYGTLEPAVVIPDCGHLDLVEIVQAAWQTGVPNDFLPICEDNGDYYCFAPDSRIVLWSHDGLSSGSWSNLEKWIQQVWIG
ncbi:MAG: SMI1/KNR4 family protein [Verrucomicrobiota bacterium]